MWIKVYRVASSEQSTLLLSELQVRCDQGEKSGQGKPTQQSQCLRFVPTQEQHGFTSCAGQCAK